MNAIKRFFLRLLILLIAAGMVGAMLVLFINSRVKHSTEDQILYLIQGETEISALGQESLKDFGADCALVLGCGIEDAETPSPMLKDRHRAVQGRHCAKAAFEWRQRTGEP